jgi:hypothetical protein
MKNSDPCTLPLGRLKKVAATEGGVSPKGNHDEILTALVAYLKKKRRGRLRRLVLFRCLVLIFIFLLLVFREGQAGQKRRHRQSPGAHETTTPRCSPSRARGGGAAITAASSTATMRKAYLKLSLLLYPDHNRDNPDAAKRYRASRARSSHCRTRNCSLGRARTGRGRRRRGRRRRSSRGRTPGASGRKLSAQAAARSGRRALWRYVGNGTCVVWLSVWCSACCMVCCTV